MTQATIITIGDELPTGIVRLAKVYIAKKRKVKVGDKMANKNPEAPKIQPSLSVLSIASDSPLQYFLKNTGCPRIRYGAGLSRPT